MSKLSFTDDADLVPRAKHLGPVLRRNRKKPLHPEEIERRLREKSVAEMPKTGWHWPFGWLLIVFLDNDQRRYRDIPASCTYEDAIRIRDLEYAAPDCEGTLLIRKTYEKK